MPVSVVDSDTTTPGAIGTREAFGGAAITDSGFFVLMVDVNAMTGSDQTTFEIETKVLSGGTARMVMKHTLPIGVQPDKVFTSIVLPSDIECTFYINQIAGTARAYPWKILKLGTPRVITSGTKTTTVGTTPDELANSQADETFTLIVDTAALAIGDGSNQRDSLIMYAETKILSGGTYRQAFKGHANGPQIMAVKMSQPIPSDIDARFYINQPTGVARSFPWKIISSEPA